MQLRCIRDHIESMGPVEHAEVHRILKQHGARFSRNANGIFVNIVGVAKEALDSIQAFVEQRVNAPNADADFGGPTGSVYDRASGDGTWSDVPRDDLAADVEAARSNPIVARYLECMQQKHDEVLARKKTTTSQKYKNARKRWQRQAEAANGGHLFSV